MDINLGLGELASVALSALLAWLKVDHHLHIGWWLVFLPVWIGPVVVVLFFGGLLIVGTIMALVKRL